MLPVSAAEEIAPQLRRTARTACLAAEKALTMEPAQPQQDPLTRLALQHLADIALPPPVSWMPQTWGWVMLALVAAALLICCLVALAPTAHRQPLSPRGACRIDAHRERNLADKIGRAQALEAMPELLKRVALAAWPRDAVASLSGAEWAGLPAPARWRPVVSGHRRHGCSTICEYRSTANPRSVSEDDARMFAAAARRWIEGHRVSA